LFRSGTILYGMNLLIITQKVDKEDGVLGFFHRWLEEFSKKYERVTVICLEEGNHALPENVKVLSLGKNHLEIENWKLKITARVNYIFKFFFYIWRLRKDYNAVFIHMNPEYIVLCGWFWRLWGKRVALWYNHAKGGFKVHIAAFFAHYVFYTSSYAYARHFSKARIMPAGVDLNQFTFNESINRKKNSILLLGRISPVKHIDVIIKALLLLDEKGVDFNVSVYGDSTDRDHEYYTEIQHLAKPLLKQKKLSFHQGMSNYKTPAIYNAHDIFLNATPKGSLDKTVLEAALCGAIPVVCNESFKNVLPEELFFKEGNSIDLAQTLQLVFMLPGAQKDLIRQQLQKSVAREHSLDRLVEKVHDTLSS